MTKNGKQNTWNNNNKKNRNKHFTEKEIGMVNKHLKRSSKTFVKCEMQISRTVR